MPLCLLLYWCEITANTSPLSPMSNMLYVTAQCLHLSAQAYRNIFLLFIGCRLLTLWTQYTNITTTTTTVYGDKPKYSRYVIIPICSGRHAFYLTTFITEERKWGANKEWQRFTWGIMKWQIKMKVKFMSLMQLAKNKKYSVLFLEYLVEVRLRLTWCHSFETLSKTPLIV